MTLIRTALALATVPLLTGIAHAAPKVRAKECARYDVTAMGTSLAKRMELGLKAPAYQLASPGSTAAGPIAAPGFDKWAATLTGYPQGEFVDLLQAPHRRYRLDGDASKPALSRGKTPYVNWMGGTELYGFSVELNSKGYGSPAYGLNDYKSAARRVDWTPPLPRNSARVIVCGFQLLGEPYKKGNKVDFLFEQVFDVTSKTAANRPLFSQRFATRSLPVGVIVIGEFAAGDTTTEVVVEFDKRKTLPKK